MPAVLIEVRKKYTPEQESGIMQAVYTALRDAFKINDDSIIVRLLTHEPHRFSPPPHYCQAEPYPQPEYYTHISIDCMAGRSLDIKRSLYADIVNRLETFGIPKDHVKILIRETSKENWGIKGGVPACEVDLGYSTNI